MNPGLRASVQKFLLYLLIAAPFFFFGVRLMMAGLGLAFLGGALIILGAIIVARSFGGIVAFPVANLFFPDESDPAPPMYSIPESHVKKGLYEQAIREYEEIAAKYPKETKPYVDMMEIAFVRLKDPQRARQIFQRGLTVLRTDQQRAALTRMYEAYQSTATNHPEEIDEH